MPVYRGVGGAGDATADASNTSAIALAAATAAELSAATASNAATTATTQGASATASATTATNAASSATSSASSASTSATNAASSASSAATSATNAAASAALAASSITASTVATEQAAIATTQATNAQASATAAAASFDSFDDRYLGAKASAPSLDNDGNALLTGALYWNSGSNSMSVYTGSAWVSVVIPPPGAIGNLLTSNGTNWISTAPSSSFNYASLLKFQ